MITPSPAPAIRQDRQYRHRAPAAARARVPWAAAAVLEGVIGTGTRDAVHSHDCAPFRGGTRRRVGGTDVVGRDNFLDRAYAEAWHGIPEGITHSQQVRISSCSSPLDRRKAPLPSIPCQPDPARSLVMQSAKSARLATRSSGKPRKYPRRHMSNTSHGNSRSQACARMHRGGTILAPDDPGMPSHGEQQRYLPPTQRQPYGQQQRGPAEFGPRPEQPSQGYQPPQPSDDFGGFYAARQQPQYIPAQPAKFYRFNPPPGWPQPRPGWIPPAGPWGADPSWPAAPPGWQFWLAPQVEPVSNNLPGLWAKFLSQPRKVRNRWIAVAAVALVLLVALIVSGSLGSSGASAVVTGCGLNSDGTAYANLTIINKTSSSGDIYVDVGFYQDGSEFNSNNDLPTVGAGSTYDDTITSISPAPNADSVACKVLEVDSP